MRYKGWEIGVSVMMPRSFWINDVFEDSKVKFDKEIPYKPVLKPQNYYPYQYIAAKDDKWLAAKNITALKKLIEKEA